jgi:predicted porin
MFTKKDRILKKTLIVAAILASASITASAQSNVTVFGVADLDVRSVDNGSGSQKQVASSGLTTSRLGLRGTEDLGGGLQAGFWLEHGLQWDTGTQLVATQFWNRRSSVSLSSTQWGEVRLGRFLTAQYLGYGNFDPFGDAGVGAIGNLTSVLGSTATTKVRANNLVSYFLPKNLGGVYGQFDVAAGEGVSGQKYSGALLGYAAGPLDVAVSFGSTDVTGGKYDMATLGATYKFDFGTLMGNWHQMKNTANDRKLVHTVIGGTVPVGAGEVRASFSTANANGGGTGADDARMVALGYVYNLSKRTALYTTYARISNDGAASFVVSSGPAAVAGKASTGYDIGIRHSF